jgi:hypothetical protein
VLVLVLVLLQAVLGLATGSTPKTLYKELVRLHQEEGLSFANVVTFNLDEYYPMYPGSLQVCTSWGGLSDTLKGGIVRHTDVWDTFARSRVAHTLSSLARSLHQLCC